MFSLVLKGGLDGKRVNLLYILCTSQRQTYLDLGYIQGRETVLLTLQSVQKLFSGWRHGAPSDKKQSTQQLHQFPHTPGSQQSRLVRVFDAKVLFGEEMWCAQNVQQIGLFPSKASPQTPQKAPVTSSFVTFLQFLHKLQSAEK